MNINKDRTLVLIDRGIVRLIRLDEQSKTVWTIGSQKAEKAYDITLMTEILCDRQGLFRLSGGQWTYENNPDSFFGTWYNDVPLGRAGKNQIEGARILKDGDVLRIRTGVQMVLFLYLEEGPKGSWEKLFLGDEGTSLWAGTDRDTCRIVIRSPGTAPRNTRFIKIEGDWYVEAGPNVSETFLNGSSLMTRQRLVTGDLIMIGQTYLVFMDGVLFYPVNKEETKGAVLPLRGARRIPSVFLTVVLAFILCIMFLMTQTGGDGNKTSVSTAPTDTVIPSDTKESGKKSQKAVNEMKEDKGIYGYEPRQFSNYVFGSRYRRNEIRKIVFKDTLEEKAEDAWDISSAGNGSIYAWVRDEKLTIASDGIISLPSDCSGLFAAYTGLRTIDFGENIDTSSVSNMESMFERCYNLTALDLSGFDTSGVTTMAHMFSKCRSLSALMIGNFNTSQVNDMTAMFSGCNSLEEADLSSFDTRNVKGMESIFQDCREISYLDLTSFDTSNVESGRNMFSGCYSMGILSFDPSSFRTGSMTDMYGMFKECYRLKSLNVRSFDTSKVRNMSYMFYKDRKLTGLDCSNFDMSKVSENDKMFKGTQWEDTWPIIAENEIADRDKDSTKTETDTDAGKDVYGAYFDILMKYEGKIRSWENKIKGYNSWYEDTDEAYYFDEKQIVINDINADGITELMFVADTDSQTNEGWEDYTEDLYLFTFRNGQAVKIYQERIFTEAAGGYRYLIVKTEDNQLVIMDTGIDEFEDCSIDRYSLQGGQLKKGKHDGLYYTPNPYEEESMYSIARDGEYVPVTEAEFESYSQVLSSDFKTVLMKSGGGIELSIYGIQDRQNALSMTYDEALQLLSDSNMPSQGIEEQSNKDKSWKQAYVDYIKTDSDIEINSEWCTCGLIYLDGDEIPELIIEYSNEADGTGIVSFKNGKTVNYRFSRTGGIRYIEKKGQVYNSVGHQGLTIDELVLLDSEGFHDQGHGNRYDESQEYSNYTLFNWNGAETSEKEYNAKISVFDVARSENWNSYSEEMKTNNFTPSDICNYLLDN